MFYDERIEKLRGRICRNAVILGGVIAAVSLLLRTVTVIRSVEELAWRDLYLFVPEAVICLGALIVLLLGACRGVGQMKDEMWQTEQAHFYSRAARCLLYVIVGTEAVCLPFSVTFVMPNAYYSTVFDAVLPVLLFALGAYCICAFRENDVYFNYSILEGKGYARGVAKNLGRAGLLALGCLGVSLVIAFLAGLYLQLHDAALLKVLLLLLFDYVGVVIALGVLYLLLSYLEWASFTRRAVISPATLIALLLAVLIYLNYAAIVVGIDRLPVDQGTAVALVNYAAYLKFPVRIMFVLFLTYFGYEYRRREEDRWVRIACRAMVVAAAATVVAELVYSGAMGIFMPVLIGDDGYRLSQVLVVVSGIIRTAEGVVNGLGLVAILLSLIRAKRVARGHMVTPFMLAAVWGVEIFLSTQIDVFALTLCHTAVSAVLLIYALVLLCTVRWERGGEEL